MGSLNFKLMTDKLLRHSTSLCVVDLWVNILGAGMQVDAPLLPVEFLLEQKIITRLVDRIAPPAGPDGRASASLILEGLLQNGYCSEFPDAPTAPLVEELKGADCTGNLVGFCTDESEATQLHAMAVLSALLEMLRDEPDGGGGFGGDDGDADGADAAGTDGVGSELLAMLAGQGEVFAAALKKPPPFGSCVLTFGEVPETLGSKRLALIQFLLVMLRSRSAAVVEMFVSSALAAPIVSLFFALPFNNLLHNLLLSIVRTSVTEIEESGPLVKSILVEGGLCAQVVRAFEGYDLKQDDVFQRAGYFGQLHLLAAELSESTAPCVVDAVAALDEEVKAGWSALSDDGGVLNRLRDVENQPIGGSRPGLVSTHAIRGCGRVLLFGSIFLRGSLVNAVAGLRE